MLLNEYNEFKNMNSDKLRNVNAVIYHMFCYMLSD
jgi:hypothetical protein